MHIIIAVQNNLGAHVVYNSQARESDDGLLLCIADCLIGCLETFLEMFNQWGELS